MNAIVHPDRAAASEASLILTGTLIAPACARVKQLDGDGHTVPVIVLDIESDRGLHMPLRVDQHFPPGRMDQAEAAARRYHTGQRVQVQASALSVRLACVATHIHILPENETCPDASTSSP